MLWNKLINEGSNTVSSNLKVANDFIKTFKNPANVFWSDIANGNLAEFIKGGITTKVFYDRKGKCSGVLCSYLEVKMPGDIRHLIKRQYYDFNIYYVQEVNVADKTAYLIKIEDKTYMKTIRILDGEMKELEAFKISR